MESLKINTGIIRLQVDCDGAINEISFNPNDIGFVENLYKIMGDLDKRKSEFEESEKELFSKDSLDENGLPINIGERVKLIKEICEYTRGKIDVLFGEGASEKIFGTVNTIDMFEQFFDGITPYIKNARSKKLAKYKRSAATKNVMH